MYGLMHAGLLWSKKFGGELIAKGFERSQADPCVFRRKHLGKVVVTIIVVYVDDLLVLSETKQDEHQALEDLRSSFPIKDLGGAACFLRQLKAFMVPPIDYNIRVHEDNEGAIKMAENRFSSRRTRHIDVKHHMVRDAVDGGIIRVEYVSREDSTRTYQLRR
ncbi:unnamed protein product [Ascophyllum nodosum]